MASAIAHFIVGAALALPAIELRTIREGLPRWAIPVSCGVLAVAPDLDTFAMRVFGIPYGSFFGHRGFFHSPFFLILLAVAPDLDTFAMRVFGIPYGSFFGHRGFFHSPFF